MNSGVLVLVNGKEQRNHWIKNLSLCYDQVRVKFGRLCHLQLLSNFSLFTVSLLTIYLLDVSSTKMQAQISCFLLLLHTTTTDANNALSIRSSYAILGLPPSTVLVFENLWMRPTWHTFPSSDRNYISYTWERHVWWPSSHLPLVFCEVLLLHLYS